MDHSELVGYVDNDNTRNTSNGSDTGNADNNYSLKLKESPLRLDTQLAEVGLAGRRLPTSDGGAGGHSAGRPCPGNLKTGEAHEDSTDRRDWPRDRSGRSHPFPSTSPPSLSPFCFASSAVPSSAKQPAPTQYNDPEQPQHTLKPYIPIPTPFEYSDEDGNDFRGDYDFDSAWAGSEVPDPNTAMMKQLEGSTTIHGSLSQVLPDSPQRPDLSPSLSSSPSSTGSGTSYGTILTPKILYEDQEYCDIMYKLDLGAESPYLGSTYTEAFETHGYQLSRPLSTPPSGKARASTDSSLITDSGADAPTVAASSKNDTHCGICLRKAISPCRTKCCNRLFCRGHISDWLKSKESAGLCPSCDVICVLPPVMPESSSSEPVLRRRGFSSPSLSPSHSRTSSSVSTASTSSTSSESSSESGQNTRVNTRSNTASSATLTLVNSTVNSPTADEEAEDLWDVKNAWKKDGGGSLDFAEMARGVVDDVVNGSMNFVGLSGGVRAGVREHRQAQVEEREKQVATTTTPPHGTAVAVERRSRLSPKELVKEVSQFTQSLVRLGDVTEVEDVGEIGEGGVTKRMVSIIGLVVVLFVLFK